MVTLLFFVAVELCCRAVLCLLFVVFAVQVIIVFGRPTFHTQHLLYTEDKRGYGVRCYGAVDFEPLFRTAKKNYFPPAKLHHLQVHWFVPKKLRCGASLTVKTNEKNTAKKT